VGFTWVPVGPGDAGTVWVTVHARPGKRIAEYQNAVGLKLLFVADHPGMLPFAARRRLALLVGNFVRMLVTYGQAGRRLAIEFGGAPEFEAHRHAEVEPLLRLAIATAMVAVRDRVPGGSSMPSVEEVLHDRVTITRVPSRLNPRALTAQIKHHGGPHDNWHHGGPDDDWLSWNDLFGPEASQGERLAVVSAPPGQAVALPSGFYGRF